MKNSYGISVLTSEERSAKASWKRVFSICIDIAAQGLAPHLSELDRYKTVEGIVGLSAMLEVPEDKASIRSNA